MLIKDNLSGFLILTFNIHLTKAGGKKCFGELKDEKEIVRLGGMKTQPQIQFNVKVNDYFS